jgi:hypothetical protein
MMAFNNDSEVPPDVIEDHERRTGTNVKAKAQYRDKHLDKSYRPLPKADEKGPHLELVLKGTGN